MVQLIDRFLDNACPDHHVRGAWDHMRAQHTAMRMLARHPELPRASFASAVVCGELAEVERQLADRPSLAVERSSEPDPARSASGGGGDLYRALGPKGWTPLLYLCFTRLPLAAANDNAVAIARLLLDHGADPNAFFMAGGSRYTPFVGVAGEGEEDRPPHPRRDALARVLLERGAEPYDIQVVYDIGFRGEVRWFLEMIHERSLQLGRAGDWQDPEWSMLSMGGYGSGARWHLDVAIKKDDVHLAEWCLAHGASPTARPASDPRFPRRSLYEEAVRRGRSEIAALLVRHGARATDVPPDPMTSFVAACFRLDRHAAEAMLDERPELRTATEPLFAAAREDRADVVVLLLDLGVSSELEDANKQRTLHVAAGEDALAVARLLIDRGAEIDPIEASYGNTPLAAAVHHQHAEMIELLAAHSRDVWQLTFAGRLDRLTDVIAERPAAARAAGEGETLLMWLPPHDEACAIAIAELLLAHGADPTVVNRDGMTAADRAEAIAMWELADRLRRAAG